MYICIQYGNCLNGFQGSLPFYVESQILMMSKACDDIMTMYSGTFLSLQSLMSQRINFSPDVSESSGIY